MARATVAPIAGTILVAAEMKVLVCGDREWKDCNAIARELKKLPKGTVVVHGGCRGADTIAGVLAEKILKVAAVPVLAQWKTYGRAAGPIRNQQMLDENPDIDLVLAFHENLEISKGTADMIRRARFYEIPVKVFTK